MMALFSDLYMRQRVSMLLVNLGACQDYEYKAIVSPNGDENQCDLLTDDCTSVHRSQQSGGFAAYGVSLWTIAICMTSTRVLLGHCTLIPFQFNGIVLVQLYFTVIANSVFFWYKNRVWTIYLSGNFQYGGVAWVAASHITGSTTVSQKLILVDNT